MTQPTERPACRLPLLLVPLLAASALAQQPFCSPQDRVDLEGSSFTSFPLGRPNARFQFLHADLPGGMTLNGQAFRRDATELRGQVDGFSVEMEITASLSPNTPATASATFAQNIGPAPVVVLPRTVVSFPATLRPQLDPAPTFELVIPYAQAFVVPPAGGTVCIDITVFGNTSPAGLDRALSLYLDAHEVSTSAASQPGYRMGGGCAPTNATTPATALMDLTHNGSGLLLDVRARDGVRDNGAGRAFSYLAVGQSRSASPWPYNPACVLQTSTEQWYVLGPNDGFGDCSAQVAWPLVPDRHRLWLQVGSIELGQADLVFSDLSSLMTPPAPPAALPAVRIAASSDRTAAAGAISRTVPVTMFF